jgi:hypothetical protein
MHKPATAPTLAQSIANKCRHFNGLFVNEKCSAGVRYRDVQDDDTLPARYPCLKNAGCSERCRHASFLTPDEVKAEESRIKRAMQQYFEDLGKEEDE